MISVNAHLLRDYQDCNQVETVLISGQMDMFLKVNNLRFSVIPNTAFSPIRTCPYMRIDTGNMNPSCSSVEISDGQNLEGVILKCLLHFSQTGTFDDSVKIIKVLLQAKKRVSLYPDGRTCPFK